MATDPFETLRLPNEPIAPRASFVTSLRARMERALGVSQAILEGQLMSNAPETAPGLHTITPYICVRGAADAIEFYISVFDAVEEGERYVDQSDGKIGHAQIRIGNSALMISDEYPDYGVGGPATFGGTSVALHLYVDDLEATYAKAVSAGAEGLRPPADEFYGRTATIIDPWGHRWSLQMVVNDRPLPTVEGFDVIDKG
jgi:PhnB protein